MAYIPDLKPTNDPISYWGNCVKDSNRENKIFISSDFVCDTNVGGTSLELAPQYRYAQIPDVYTGEWNITGSYNVGDIMRVMPDHDYIYTDLKNACYLQQMFLNGSFGSSGITWPGYTNGQIIECHHKSNGFVQLGGSGGDWVTPVLYVKPFPGVYRCISHISGLFDYYDLLLMGVINQLGVDYFSYLDKLGSVNMNEFANYIGIL